MNPEILADGFLGSIVPRSAPVTPRFWRCRHRADNMRIKYMFIMQEYGLMPAAAGGFLHRECAASSGWGQRSGRSGRLEAAPGDAALPAHGLDREQHLLTIRTPRTTRARLRLPCGRAVPYQPRSFRSRKHRWCSHVERCWRLEMLACCRERQLQKESSTLIARPKVARAGPSIISSARQRQAIGNASEITRQHPRRRH